MRPTDEIDVGTLRDAAWIRDSGQGCREQLVATCAAAGFTPNVAFDSDDFPMVSGLVESGVGEALAPDLAVHQMGRRRGAASAAPTGVAAHPGARPAAALARYHGDARGTYASGRLTTRGRTDHAL